MMSIRNLGLALIGLILLAGCGREGSGARQSVTLPSQTTQAVSTVRQVASIVSKHRQPILDAIDQEDNCRAIDCFFAQNVVDRWAAMDTLQALLAIELRGARPVAPEVASLVDDTIGIALTGQKARHAYEDCLDGLRQSGAISNQKCGPELSAWQKGWRAMKPQLAAWMPYIGA